MSNPTFLLVDLFCGFGGTTTGFDIAEIDGCKVAKVIACVNHDPKAIKSHWMNHPEVVHYEEDIRTLDLTGLIEIVSKARAKYPDAKLILWASLECTNFSKAKGGQPRDADSRTLAEHLYRYQQAIDPEYVMIENVVEFMSWGPLDENGKPISRRNGSEWMCWKNTMCEFGYYDEWKELNSADFGAYTSRNRLFGCFAKHHLPIVWPSPSHSKNPTIDMFGGLKKWKPVKDVLNFEDEGESIFTRKKPLSDKTLERIFAGLIKFVAKGDKSFLSKYFSGRPEGKNITIDGPTGAIKTVDSHALIQTEFLLKYNSINGKTGVHHPPSVEDPAPTIACQGRLGLVQTKFLAAYYGSGDNISEVNSPCPTIPTKDRFALVQPEYFIDKHFGKNAQNQSIENPAGTILPTDKHRLVTVEPFIMPTHFNNNPKSVDEPCSTITANRKYHYIVNPSHGGHSTSTEAPCPVIIARQDKAPLYLVQTKEGKAAIAIYDCDSEAMIRIKVFMSEYGLSDIKMRMLRVAELLKIQGFPEDYKMAGNQTDHKKFIGNSVHPLVPKAWAEALAIKLYSLQKKIA